MSQIFCAKKIHFPWYKKQVPGQLWNIGNLSFDPCITICRSSPKIKMGISLGLSIRGFHLFMTDGFPLIGYRYVSKIKNYAAMHFSSRAKLVAGSELLWIHKMIPQKKASLSFQSIRLQKNLR